MGGDHGPVETVAGAVLAARSGGIQIALVGDPDNIEPELGKHDADGLPITVVPSEGVIGEDEPPAMALRQKPRSSIMVATGMIKRAHADACVTMGSTGAAMAAAAVVLGVIDGLDRPALGGPVLGLAPRTVVIDLGSNVDCKPSQLLSFAVIGEVFARVIWGVERPRVALLSVGSETGKGNRQVRETTPLLENSGLNFIGNVEPGDLPGGPAEVVVCDGFVGNMIMKLSEGLGQGLSNMIESNYRERVPGETLSEISQEVYALNNVLETFGGGPLFGVNGVSVVGHGRTNAAGVERAIGTAKACVENGLVSTLNDELARVRESAGVDE